jgi:hypothetical protein
LGAALADVGAALADVKEERLADLYAAIDLRNVVVSGPVRSLSVRIIHSREASCPA